MSKQLQAGFGRQCITPDYSVPLAGYGATHKRMSTNVLSDIYISCIAFSFGDEQLLLFTQDLIRAHGDWVAAARSRVSAKTGIAQERILFCATHTHSGPDPYSNLPCMKEYLELYLSQAEAAAQQALEDLAPICMYQADTQTERMNFIRHYLLENGTYAGPNFGNFRSAPIVGHAAENDPQLRLVKLERQEKPSILMVNFQVHPTATGGGRKTNLSADFVGVVRDCTEASTGMHFAYFTGAAGNQVIGTQIPEERDNMTAEQYRSFGGGNYLIYGWRLAQYIYKALPSLQKMDTNALAIRRTLLEQPLNRDDLDRCDDAVRVRKLWMDTDVTTANKLAKELGFSSVYHASAILSRRERPETGIMELNAVRIGDMSFVTLPYEVFCALGVSIKEYSPFPMTMIFSCANAGLNYVPTREAYEYGCYESCTSYFAKGAGEAAVQELLALLNSLKDSDVM